MYKSTAGAGLPRGSDPIAPVRASRVSNSFHRMAQMRPTTGMAMSECNHSSTRQSLHESMTMIGSLQ